MYVSNLVHFNSHILQSNNTCTEQFKCLCILSSKGSQQFATSLNPNLRFTPHHPIYYRSFAHITLRLTLLSTSTVYSTNVSLVHIAKGNSPSFFRFFIESSGISLQPITTSSMQYTLLTLCSSAFLSYRIAQPSRAQCSSSYVFHWLCNWRIYNSTLVFRQLQAVNRMLVRGIYQRYFISATCHSTSIPTINSILTCV